MPAILLYGVLVVSVTTCQAIYTLRTGNVGLFFLRSVDPKPSERMRRLGYALVYFSPSVVLAAFVAATIQRSGIDRLVTWLLENYGVLTFSVTVSIVGLLHLLYPARMLQSTLRDHPEISNRASAAVFARILGAGFIGAGVAMLIGR